MDLFWQITIVEFLLNVAVFAVAVIAYGPLSSIASRITRWPKLNEGVAVGALFGAATTVALLMPVHLDGGAAGGSKTVLLALAAPLGGFPAAVTAGVISLAVGLFRWAAGELPEYGGLCFASGHLCRRCLPACLGPQQRRRDHEVPLFALAVPRRAVGRGRGGTNLVFARYRRCTYSCDPCIHIRDAGDDDPRNAAAPRETPA